MPLCCPCLLLLARSFGRLNLAQCLAVASAMLLRRLVVWGGAGAAGAAGIACMAVHAAPQWRTGTAGLAIRRCSAPLHDCRHGCGSQSACPPTHSACPLTYCRRRPNPRPQVRTQTLVKGCIIEVDAAPFKQWYQQHYGVEVGQKKKAAAAAPAEGEAAAQSNHVKRKLKQRNQVRPGGGGHILVLSPVRPMLLLLAWLAQQRGSLKRCGDNHKRDSRHRACAGATRPPIPL